MMVQTELPALKSLVNASPISPDSQQQQTNEMNSSNKILVILISLLTIVVIIVSILITITIVLCFLRQQNNRKQNKRDCNQTKESGLSVKSTVNKKKRSQKLSQTHTKTSDDSIATSDGSVHPDVIPCDGVSGVVFYNNDHNIIDDDSCDNRFNANNSLSIYRDIIVGTTDEHNEQRVVNKNILTNNINHVSVINDDMILVQTHHNSGQAFNTLVTKFTTYSNTNQIEVILIGQMLAQIQTSTLFYIHLFIAQYLKFIIDL